MKTVFSQRVVAHKAAKLTAAFSNIAVAAKDEPVSYELWCSMLEGTYQVTSAGFFDRLFDKFSKTNSMKFIMKMFGTLKGMVEEVAEEAKLSVKDIALGLMNKDVFFVLKSFGFSLLKMFKGILHFEHLLIGGMLRVFQQLEKSGFVQKIKQGLASVDEFFAQHPMLKKIVGPALAGALLWIWLTMSFSGLVGFDLDLSTVFKAFVGSFTLEHLFASAEGLAMVTFLIAGIATGGAFGAKYLGNTIGNLLLALVWTGYQNTPALKTKAREIRSKLPPKLFKPIHIGV